MLRAIYMDDIDIIFYNDVPTKPETVTYVVAPALADQKTNTYVSIILELKLDKNYPKSIATVTIKNPRGLSDTLVNEISNRLHLQAEERQGSPMLYELIETAKDFITEQKLPSCGCAICLCDFEEQEDKSLEDDFLRTDCFHFFHLECLSRYVQFRLKEIALDLEEKIKLNPDAEADLVGCPVCRVALGSDLLESLPIQDETEVVNPLLMITKHLKKNRKPVVRRHISSIGWDLIPLDIKAKLQIEQKERAKQFERQKAKGAIIDVEAEKSKYKLSFAVVDTVQGETEKENPLEERDQLRDDPSFKKYSPPPRDKKLQLHERKHKDRFRGQREHKEKMTNSEKGFSEKESTTLESNLTCEHSIEFLLQCNPSITSKANCDDQTNVDDQTIDSGIYSSEDSSSKCLGEHERPNSFYRGANNYSRGRGYWRGYNHEGFRGGRGGRGGRGQYRGGGRGRGDRYQF